MYVCMCMYAYVCMLYVLPTVFLSVCHDNCGYLAAPSQIHGPPWILLDVGMRAGLMTVDRITVSIYCSAGEPIVVSAVLIRGLLQCDVLCRGWYDNN